MNGYCARHFWLAATSCTCWSCPTCGDVQAVPARDCCGYCSRCCRSAGLCAPRNLLGHYVARTWRDGDGRPRAYEIVATGALEDVTFTITRGPAGWQLSGAPAQVWANPAAYGFEPRLCPGHDGGPCEYGAHDWLAYTADVPMPEPVMVRMADLRPGDVYANADGTPLLDDLASHGGVGVGCVPRPRTGDVPLTVAKAELSGYRADLGETWLYVEASNGHGATVPAGGKTRIMPREVSGQARTAAAQPRGKEQAR